MKSSTDLHWNTRASTVKDDIEVNIMDIFQRELEFDKIIKYLSKDMSILEVGCGNGFSTSKLRPLVKSMVSFDYAEDMIKRAKEIYGETNNKFYHDNVLDPKHVNDKYDVVLCVRVLINLRSLEEQRLALRNLMGMVKPDGKLILVEGFTEGFVELSKERLGLKMSPVEPAKINVYTSSDDCLAEVKKQMKIDDEFHLGAYDFLTRVVYPYIVGPENVRPNSNFNEKCSDIARNLSDDHFGKYSRIKGFILSKLSS